jgi:hypothetical protein
MALGDLWQRSSQLGDLGELTGGRPDASERGNGETEGRRIDLQPVAGDHSSAFHALHPLSDRRSAHLHTSCQGRHGNAWLTGQLSQQSPIDLVE